MVIAAALLLSSLHAQEDRSSATVAPGDWPMYNRDLKGTRPFERLTPAVARRCGSRSVAQNAREPGFETWAGESAKGATGAISWAFSMTLDRGRNALYAVFDAVPITYMGNNTKQYVAIVAAGRSALHDDYPEGTDALAVFTLR